MALTKDYALPNGIVATYHKIADFHVDYMNKSAAMTVHCFMNKDIRDAGGEPLARLGYPVSVDLETDKLPTRAELYATLKAAPVDGRVDFTDAKDC